MRVEIIGLSPSEKRKPHPSENESWGLPWSPLSHRYDRYFEMHDRSLWERRGEEYIEFLRNTDVPIYMQKKESDIPSSVEFPLKACIAEVGDYFNSSIAYMLALAIHEGHDMDIWGVDNHPYEEFAYERPCNEYLIGMAKGKGLDVWIEPSSSLLRFVPDILYLNERQKYAGRYGWLAETK